MNETYTVMFLVDYETDTGWLVTTENDRSGTPRIVNVMDDIEEIGEIYEKLTGRESY